MIWTLMAGTHRVQGERYFTCKQNYGAFVRADKLRVGDYPPVDELALEDEEM
jgi:tubulin-folding cofactor B